jgi:hypothetical protein
MTRARSLKQAIRARAAKTGERYTTARRHVLKNLTLVPRLGAPRAPEPEPPAARASKKRESPISEAKFISKTVHGFDHLFAILDKFDGVKKGHTAAARHLYETHGVDGWYAQGITVAYERARGVRVANQRCDGAFEVSVSKTIPGDVKTIVRALTNAAPRGRLQVPDKTLLPALAAALDSPKSKGFVIRPDGLGRYRYKWGDTTVQFYMVPKAGNKVSVTVTNMNLANAAAVEERRSLWRETLSSLAGVVTRE